MARDLLVSPAQIIFYKVICLTTSFGPQFFLHNPDILPPRDPFHPKPVAVRPGASGRLWDVVYASFPVVSFPGKQPPFPLSVSIPPHNPFAQFFSSSDLVAHPFQPSARPPSTPFLFPPNLSIPEVAGETF